MSTPTPRGLRLLTALVCALLLQAPLQSQAAPPAAPARAYLEELRLQVGSPGLSAAVAVNGEVVLAEGFGLADVESQVPVSPETRFRVGSISKLLTVAAVAKLVEAGKLDLDAPVQRYVPSFPEKEQPITPRQLAGHLAGIRHYTPADFGLPLRHYDRLSEGLAIFQKDPLVHAPGAAYLYSSYGYNLLGAVVEGASGRDFASAVGELVLAPLELRGTALDEPALIVERRARPYRREPDGRLANERPIDSSYKWPSGGFLSTAVDLARFGSAHLRDGYLKPETRALLFTSQSVAGEETGVGLGWRTGKDGAGRRILHHGGSIEGGRAFLLLYPEHGVAVAILTNLSGARFAEAEAQKLAELFLQ